MTTITIIVWTDRDGATNYAFDWMEIMDNYDAVEKKEDENFEFLRKHNLCAREHDPKFSLEIKHMLSPFYANIITSKNSRASPRVLRLLRNLSYAVARLKLKDTVDEEDVIEVMEFYKKQLENFDQIVDISKKPLEYVRESYKGTRRFTI